MSSYQTFTSPRLTEPDPTSLLSQLKALDASAGVQHTDGSPFFVLKKATIWTGPQTTAAQNVLDTAPATSERLSAQAAIDAMSIFEKAIILAIIDEINRLRTQPTTTFIAFTMQQAIAAVRTKAGTL